MINPRVARVRERFIFSFFKVSIKPPWRLNTGSMKNPTMASRRRRKKRQVCPLQPWNESNTNEAELFFLFRSAPSGPPLHSQLRLRVWCVPLGSRPDVLGGWNILQWPCAASLSSAWLSSKLFIRRICDGKQCNNAAMPCLLLPSPSLGVSSKKQNGNKQSGPQS